MKLPKPNSLIVSPDSCGQVLANPLSRRMFIRGMGSALAIPFLPSLFGDKAMAQTSSSSHFIFMNVTHGRTLVAWNPLNAAPVTVAPGVRAQKLANISGGLGYIIGNRLNDVREKLTMIQGLDASGPSDHYWFPWNASPMVNGSREPDKFTPSFGYSIDDVLSKSSKIYATTPSLPVLRIDPKEGFHTFSYTGRANGGLATQFGAEGKTVASTWQAVSQYINPSNGSGPSVDLAAAKKKYLVDQFLNESKNVLGNRQISSADKNVLQNFIDNLNDVQKRIVLTPPPPPSNMACTTPNVQNTTDNITLNQRLMDIMAIAMACGVTKIGTYHLNWAACMHPTDNLGDRYSPNVHETIHGFSDEDNYQKMLLWWGTAIDHYGYMVRKMDSLGLLDKSVVVFTGDFSSSTQGHHGIDLPMLTAGSLNGKLATGEFISYYNMNQSFDQTYGFTPDGNKYGYVRPGRRYNEFLVTLLNAAGLTPAEYQRQGVTGFGSYDCNISGCEGAEGGLNGKLMTYWKSSAYPNPDPNAPLPYFYKG